MHQVDFSHNAKKATLITNVLIQKFTDWTSIHLSADNKVPTDSVIYNNKVVFDHKRVYRKVHRLDFYSLFKVSTKVHGLFPLYQKVHFHHKRAYGKVQSFDFYSLL